jgi:hypothetical protein
VIVLGLLALLELILSGTFIYYFLFGHTSEYLLGGLLVAQLLVVSLVILSYYKSFVPFQEISEDRDEEFLW